MDTLTSAVGEVGEVQLRITLLRVNSSVNSRVLQDVTIDTSAHTVSTWTQDLTPLPPPIK